jgi:hypothetical protein
MEKDFLEHLRSLHPHITTHGTWAFFANPKTASKSMGKTSIDESWVLYRRQRRIWDGLWEEKYTSRIEKVFKFTFVRNPWERTLSAFLYLKIREVVSPDVGFDAFVKSVLAQAEGGPSSINMHFREQAPTFLHNGIQFADFIGRFECLQEDWSYVANRIGAPGTLPHINATSHGSYVNYYDDECKEIIRQLYKTEIEFLGYEFGVALERQIQHVP